MMNWDNLHKKECPYCNEELIKKVMDMKCIQCKFNMTIDRFNNMTQKFYGREASDEVKKLKWQNIKNSQCPECDNYLYQKHGIGLLYCIDLKCDFKISEGKIKEILNDEEHPINRFKNPIEDNNKNETY